MPHWLLGTLVVWLGHGAILALMTWRRHSVLKLVLSMFALWPMLAVLLVWDLALDGPA
jgi:hypothetical protein